MAVSFVPAEQTAWEQVCPPPEELDPDPLLLLPDEEDEDELEPPEPPWAAICCWIQG